MLFINFKVSLVKFIISFILSKDILFSFIREIKQVYYKYIKDFKRSKKDSIYIFINKLNELNKEKTILKKENTEELNKNKSDNSGLSKDKKNKKIKLRFDPTKEIEKNEFMFGPTEEGEVLVFDPNPPREGEIRLREITKQTPRTKFICLAYTVECSRFGRSLASEIGPASAMTKQANTQEEKRIKKILEYLYREDDETKEFVERYLRGENAESIRKFYFYKRVNSVYLKYKRLKKRYPNAPWPPNRYEKG